MGIHLNPGGEGFATLRRGRYVDKSGLIALINRALDTKNKLFCVSRPRRFGKSTAAQMLAAYYGKGTNTANLFDDLEISRDSSYQTHLNRYDVLLLDITKFISEAGMDVITSSISKTVIREIAENYPDVRKSDLLSDQLVYLSEFTGNKTIIIIDEWDAPVRDTDTTPEIQKKYLEFLRSLFKNINVTDRAIAAAYLTGILPVKKDGSHSAISEFNEFTMMAPGMFAPYTGFVETEVEELCKEYHLDFALMRSWYDGYSFNNCGSIYNPNSVMEAVRNHEFDSYWEMSSAADSLLMYINMDYDGMGAAVSKLLAGQSLRIETGNFQNDLHSFKSKDDVLTLLVHFGYLSYNKECETVQIPNDEVRLEFARSIRQVTHKDTIERIKESDRLIRDTAYGNAEAVAAQIEKIHMEECNPLNYNREEALRSVIKIAYFSYRDEYLRFEELPSGTGYADIVYLPKKHSDYPALVIELKWNKDANGAIEQIKSRNYPQSIENYGADILLVGISYDKEDNEKKHRCVIERLRNDE